jgi:oligosaccharide repeat unit polymerase
MFDIADKLLAMIFSLAILGQAYLVRRMVGTWLFPACIFSLFWFIYTFAPLILLFSIPIKPLPIALILLCNLTFSASTLAFNWKRAYQTNRSKSGSSPNVYSTIFLRAVYWISLPLSIICTTINSVLQGISLSDMALNLTESSGTYAGLRYSQELQVTIAGQLSLISAYLAAVFGGFRFDSQDGRLRRSLTFPLSLAPAALVMITQSAKGPFFLSAALFYGAVLSSRVSRGVHRLFDRDLAICGITAILIAVPAVTFSFISRGMQHIDNTADLADRLYYYYSSYSSAHIYAFSDWFSDYVGDSSLLNYMNDRRPTGFYTFMGLFKAVGSAPDVPMGIYSDFYKYEDIITTNIYTCFRGLILDFGVLGTLGYMLLTSLIIHWAHKALLETSRPCISTALFVFSIGHFYISYIISFLIWINIYVTFILVAAILLLNRLTASNQTTLPEPTTNHGPLKPATGLDPSP